jgi:hypothetical protein
MAMRHLFAAYTFRILKSIPMTEQNAFQPNESRASAAYTDQMKSGLKDVLKNGGMGDVKRHLVQKLIKDVATFGQVRTLTLSRTI